jgi:hypothetical protein
MKTDANALSMFCEEAAKAGSRFGKQSKSELTEKTVANIKQRLFLKTIEKSNALMDSKGFFEFIPVQVSLLHVLGIIICELDFLLFA